jgi:decaprenylphospho-beta-D-ribofuranose 2-oxidase
MSSTNWAKKHLEGWGRYPVIETECTRPERRSEVLDALADRNGEPLLAYGLGRSYGDAPLLADGRQVLTRRLDRMLAFDPETGWLRCEAGVSIEDIINTFLPRGWFPPVVPGTQVVTVGGALANNIHGKNHHVAGCWGDHVRRVELLTASGDVVVCDRGNEPELFWATAGGLGLTGLILSMEIQLYPVETPAIEMESIRVENLDEFFEVSKQSKGYTHTVSWIDCVQSGPAMGRGIFMRGRHAPSGVESKSSFLDSFADFGSKLVDGRHFEMNWLLNKATIRMFNEAYFRKSPRGMHESIVDYVPFFFPLDAVQNWNYVYGSRGFLQYQMVVPEQEACREILQIVSDSGMASFLAVIKEFGDGQFGDKQHGSLSFPQPGVTLALDFPNYGQPLFDMLDRLDDIVVDVGGRVYLGKDARLSKQNFRKMYPEWEKWKAVRDKWDPERVFQSELSKRLGLTK